MIIIATQCFPPRAGGIESLVYNLCLSLASRGHEIFVFADSAGEEDEKAFDKAHPFAIKRFGGFKPLRRRLKSRAIARLAKNIQIAGLIADSWKSIELLNTTTLPVVLCLAHGTELPHDCTAEKRQRIEAAFDKSSYVIANSNYTAERCRAFLNDATSLRVIHPGISLPAPLDQHDTEQAKASLGVHHPVMISVARLEKRKGIDKAIKLLPALLQRYPELLYVVIGEGSERRNLEKLILETSVQGHVVLKGMLTGSERDALLQQSDLFILPGGTHGNDVEGFGIACLEAACFGLPSVVGESGGVAEAVLDMQTGLVCPANDEQAMLKSIQRLIDDEPLRQTLGDGARARAHSLVWAESVKQYEGLFQI